MKTLSTWTRRAGAAGVAAAVAVLALPGAALAAVERIEIIERVPFAPGVKFGEAGEYEKLRGIAHYLFHRSCWTIGDYCYLQDLFVAEGARGRGLGRALILAVEQLARAAGASRLYWLTHETNAGARALYDRLAERSGFIQYRKLF